MSRWARSSAGPRPKRAAAPATRVLLVDDQRLFAEGLHAHCESDGLVVIRTTSCGEDAIALVRRLRPDVVVLSLLMQGLNGLEATRKITEISHATRVLLLTTIADVRRLADAWRAGAGGIALKSQPPDALIHAIREVAAGRTYVCPLSERGVLSAAESQELLTRREGQVLQLIAEGNSSRQIAALLGMSLKTAEHHRDNMRRKLGVRTTTHLVRWAIRLGLVMP